MKQRTSFFMIWIVLLGAAAYSQSVAGLGALSGSVRGASGAFISGAQVVVTNEAKGIERTVATTEAGVFTVPSLVPATDCRVPPGRRDQRSLFELIRSSEEAPWVRKST